MLHDFSDEFRYKNTEFINLNNGTLGLCPDRVIDRQIQDLKEFEKNTSQGLGNAFKNIWKIQNLLGKFIGASAQDLYLRPNITLAINEIVMTLPLSPSDEILTTSWEYGAVVNILEHKSKLSGCSLRTLDLSFLYQNLTSAEIAVEICKHLSAKTKLLVVSHIFTGNGVLLPLKELATALRERGVWLLVDGAHSPGLIDVNIERDFPDVAFYTGNLHKWFMGPKGSAFGWVRRDLQNRITPLFGSWTTGVNPPPGMSDFTEASRFAGEMLWSHSQAFSAYSALEASFEFWDTYGKEFIFSEIKKRMLYLEDHLQEAGISPLMSLRKNAAILAYEASLFPHARYHGIQILAEPILQVGLPRVPVKQNVRLSPHIHNTLFELECAVALLKSLA